MLGKTRALALLVRALDSNQHVLGRVVLQREAAINLQHIPYRGADRQSLIWSPGTVKFRHPGPTALLPTDVRSGALMFIAQTGRQSVARFCLGKPRLDRGGLTRAMVLESWFGLFAPVGTAADVHQYTQRTTGKASTTQCYARSHQRAVWENGRRPTEELGRMARSDPIDTRDW